MSVPPHFACAHPDPLLDALADALRAPGDPLAAPVLVVPHPGVGRWLGMALAKRLGIFAGVDVLPLQTWLSGRLALDGRGPGDGWRTPHLTWRILAALPDRLPAPEFEPVRALLGSGRRVDARRQAFAAQVAARFEAIDAHDPDQARAWLAGGGVGWQPALWRAVAAAGAPPAAARVAHLTQAAGAPVHLWCPDAVSPLLAEALPRLAQAGPLTAWRLDPRGAPEAALDAPWATWCAPHGQVAEALTAALGPAEVLPPPAPGPGALGQAQRRLRGQASVEGDGATVQIHACAGPLRQVEVLRDGVLALMAADPSLQPHHIGLYAPDPDRLAPFLEPLLTAPGGDLPRLPLNVADRPVGADNPVAATAAAVLTLAGSRLTAPEVLGLLQRPVVQARFGIDEGDLGVVEGWIVEAGVRWGIGADHRAAHGQPPAHVHTWRFGLDRLLLGCALPDDTGALWSGVLPFDGVEGRSTALLGRMVDFCETLFGHVRALAGPLDAQTWRRRVLAAVADLCEHTADNDDAHRALRAMLLDLDTAAAQAAGPMDREALVALLAARLEARAPGRRHLSKGMTLSALAPGRVLPARVVVLLDLDADRWPHVGPRPDDAPLLGPSPAPAQRGEAGRAALAEAVALAGDALWVLYDGVDARDGSLRPQAAELDALAQVSGLPTPRVSHPLHPFNPSTRAAAATYDPLEVAAAKALLAAPQPSTPFVAGPLPPADPGELALSDLARALSDPLAVFQQRLQVHRPSPATPPPAREPLLLDGLARWAVGEDLFHRRLALQAQPVAAQAVQAAGRLPHGVVGQVVLSEVEREIHELALAVEAAQADALPPRPPMDLDLTVDGVRLAGRVDGLCGPGRLRHQSGKVRAKHLAEAWVVHLALSVHGEFGGTSLLVGRKEDRAGRPAWHVLQPVGDPEPLLQAVLDAWRQASTTPVPLLADPTLAWVRATGGGRRATDRTRSSVQRQWGWGLDKQPLAARLYGAECPLLDDPDLQRLAHTLWGPLLQHLTVIPK